MILKIKLINMQKELHVFQLKDIFYKCMAILIIFFQL